MTETHTTRRTIGEMSADTRILYNVLVKEIVKDNKSFVAYDMLNAAIGGRDVQGKARGLLTTARKNAEKDHNILLEAVPGEGIKLTEAPVGLLSHNLDHIRRVSRRTTARVVNATAGRDMSDEERTELGVHLSLLGAIQQFCKPKAAKVLEGRVKASEAKELPTVETLRLFANGDKS